MYLHAGAVFFGYLVLVATAAPNVTLDQATITGVENGTLDKFLGIPYAQPPYAFQLLVLVPYLSYPLQSRRSSISFTTEHLVLQPEFRRYPIRLYMYRSKLNHG